MAWTQKSYGWDHTRLVVGPDPFQHWYRDNQVYFITARCRDGYRAFASEPATAVFWDRFMHYAKAHQFEPWVATLMDNHYHFVGYLKVGVELRELMRKLHGSVAKMVNDVLEREVGGRRVPFWRGEDGHDYFDGCVRDDEQYVKAYRYTLRQAERAGIVRDWRDYPHTRVFVDMQIGLEFAQANRAFLYGVPYKRYAQRKKDRGQGT
jgi:REP element-mobilizing transposase RayT